MLHRILFHGIGLLLICGSVSAAHVMNGLPSGMYILRLQAGGTSATARCINLR